MKLPERQPKTEDRVRLGETPAAAPDHRAMLRASAADAEPSTGLRVRVLASFDVEEYFHVEAFKTVVQTREWPTLESRVVRSTERLLDVLDRHRVSATFFVLGWVADRHPRLVREIRARGHEVG